MKQTTIDDFMNLPPTAPYQAHSDTSRGAAAEIEPELSHLRRVVLEHIAMAGEVGVTDEEGQTALHLEGNTYRPRRRELQQAGRVMDSGRTRKAASGRSAVVWIAGSAS